MNTDFLLKLHDFVGDFPFLCGTLAITLLLCQWVIPMTTDLMTEAAAGLSDHYLGETWRVVIINSTTNIPELFLMLLSLFVFKRLGGIGTPLGSNLANIYLIFLVAPMWLAIKWLIQGKYSQIKQLLTLSTQEIPLIVGHFMMSSVMLGFALVASWLITGICPPLYFPDILPLRTKMWFLSGFLICGIGIVIFFLWDQKLKQNRAELFHDGDQDSFDISWKNFWVGSLGVICCCALLNYFFLAWSELYSSSLRQLFGKGIFTSLHFFAGSFISSIPEITVAIRYYEEIQPNALNTALGSASVSNMTNLAIAGIGSLLAVVWRHLTL